jgi:hypothetical protein
LESTSFLCVIGNLQDLVAFLNPTYGSKEVDFDPPRWGTRDIVP